jgi:hypothetical protein
MTLVSYTSNYGRPILMADLLITSNDRRGSTEIPAFLSNVDEELPIGQQSFPYELKQKIYVIHDQIAVGLAGNVYEMTLFLQDIKSYFNHYPATLENVKNFMDNYDQESISGSSIIVLIVEISDSTLYNYITAYGKWEQYDDKWIERGIVTGTGASSFFEKLNHLTPLLSETDKDGHRGFNINLISLFMAEERYTMETIVDAWGAGFEVIEYTGSKFQKVDDLTYIVCHTEFIEQTKTVSNTPFLVMHYTYHGDILTINTYLDTEFRRYGVLPLTMKKEDFASDAIPAYEGFESKQVVCVFVIEKPEGGHYFTSILTHSESDEFTIKVSFRPPAPAYLEIQIDETISERIASEYLESMGNFDSTQKK